MAYMNQEKKKKIAAELKKVMPKDWKYSLAVRNHSTIVLTIRKAPVDLLTISGSTYSHTQLNHFRLKNHFRGELLETFTKINAALNIDNFDKSDVMTDYFHVGHYVDLNIGAWDKPFIFTGEKPKMRKEGEFYECTDGTNTGRAESMEDALAAYRGAVRETTAIYGA